jgi:hypothetical protein
LIAIGAAVSVILAQALPTAHAEPIRIAYHAPARCPNEGQFLGEVFARTALARNAAEGETAREFAVDIADRSDGSLSGSLEIHATNGPVSHRDMTATRCDELVSALALMVALAVDPEGASLSASGATSQNPGSPVPDTGGAIATWSTAGAPADAPPATPVVTPAPPVPVPPASATPLAGSTPNGGPSGPRRGSPAPRAPDATTAEEPRATIPANEAESPERGHGHWAIGTEALVLVGLVPRAAIGGSATLDYDFVPDRVTSPGLRFAVSTAVATPTFANTGGVGATLLWAWAHAEGCPVRLRLVRSLRLAPCVGLDGGFLSSSGTGLQSAPTQINPWFAAEAAARLGWTFAGRWLAHAGVAALAPFKLYALDYGPDGQTAYQPKPPYVAFEAELGLGGWLP